jgi:uncharacterized membrane protein
VDHLEPGADQHESVSPSLDRTFKVSVVLKGLDGALEMIGGLVLLVVKPETLNRLARTLTQHELSQDHRDFVARHILHTAGHLTHGKTLFAAVYLLSHGLSKVVLVVAVLRGRLWAYPGIIVLLLAFIAYQGYELAFVHLGVGLSLLTAFDIFVVWLTWREYRARRPHAPQKVSKGNS